MSKAFQDSPIPVKEKLDNFEKYVRRQCLARFLARYELFKLIVDVKGSIVECGVHHGGGLLGWAKMSSDLEPMAIHRKVIGFDTFQGFAGVAAEDLGGQANEQLKVGGFDTGVDIHAELSACIREYDENRFLNQFPKVELVKGDACETIPAYVGKNPHLVVALLFLDFDLYAPTATALQYLLPRIPRGGVLVFDEVNNPSWPGETRALLEHLHTLNGFSLRKFPFDPNLCYSVL